MRVLLVGRSILVPSLVRDGNLSDRSEDIPTLPSKAAVLSSLTVPQTSLSFQTVLFFPVFSWRPLAVSQKIPGGVFRTAAARSDSDPTAPEAPSAFQKENSTRPEGTRPHSLRAYF